MMFTFMGTWWKMAHQRRQTKSLPIGPDYSLQTLAQLFKARYWNESRGRDLEEEIQKRCEQIRERINGSCFAAAGSKSRFRPYGLILGVIFLFVSIGPFALIKLLDLIKIVNDVHGDQAELSGIWALVTLPALVIVVMIGGLMDTARVVNWFKLQGGS